ncbi:MAG: hypothetical protein AB1483_02095 [Candidatus Zixiibacteriota bacterium]
MPRRATLRGSVALINTLYQPCTPTTDYRPISNNARLSKYDRAQDVRLQFLRNHVL